MIVPSICDPSSAIIKAWPIGKYSQDAGWLYGVFGLHRISSCRFPGQWFESQFGPWLSAQHSAQEVEHLLPAYPISSHDEALSVRGEGTPRLGQFLVPSAVELLLHSLSNLNTGISPPSFVYLRHSMYYFLF